MQKVEWGWVVYRKPHNWNLWLREWSFYTNNIFIVNNKADDVFGTKGSNTFFEFSAYKEVAQYFTTDGPYIIANDTWFKTHVACFWSPLIKAYLQKPERKIFGDIRLEPSNFTEKPSPYLSSWIFCIPDRNSLELFLASLDGAMQRAGGFEISDAYRAYVEDWVTPQSIWFGWHRRHLKYEDLQRKQQCIFMEHALNRAFLENGLEIDSLGIYNPVWYKVLRLVDRLQTRFIAWGLDSKG